MKIYESSFDYNYTFPTVALAYFLRYPNPYARHVLSTDVIDRYIDPVTNRLHTTRLHLKRSKVPPGILAFLPRGLAGPGGRSQTYVLETSVLDSKEGWMKTESRNTEWTGILSVIERQEYRRQPVQVETWADKLAAPDAGTVGETGAEGTACKTTVTFVSKIGQGKLLGRGRTSDAATASGEEEARKPGWFTAWGTSGVQRTVESIGVKRTKTALVNGKEGMNVVLERLRNGGILGVLEGMRSDRPDLFPADGGGWKQVWQNGGNDRPSTDPDLSNLDR